MWKAPEGVQLDHELSRIVFATREIGCRFNLFFADRQRLRGGEGSVALASHFTYDFFHWLRTFGASKVSADFYIVSAAPPIHIEAAEASKARGESNNEGGGGDDQIRREKLAADDFS